MIIHKILFPKLKIDPVIIPVKENMLFINVKLRYRF